MPCVDCSGEDHEHREGINGNPNPLDQCGRSFMQCNNPCGVGPGNTPKCESLPSQIENFTLQFFGTVVKTMVDGKVVWSLPCSLDVGLPANPRGVDEGLACYFLRLFQNGINGLKGDPGTPGAAGAPGANSYAVVRQSFPQPTLASPLTQFLIFPNPSIVVNMGLFIPGSGYYLVTDVQPGGVVFATLTNPISNPGSSVAVGTLVIPSGIPGAQGPQGVGVAGPQGPQGPQGIQGPQGPASTTATNGYVIGSDFNPVQAITDTFQTVNLGNAISFTVPATGTYLLVGSVSLAATSKTVTPDSVILGHAEFFDNGLSSAIDGSEMAAGVMFTSTSIEGTAINISVNAVCSLVAGRVISLDAKATKPPFSGIDDTGWYNAVRASMSWVRIA